MKPAIAAPAAALGLFAVAALMGALAHQANPHGVFLSTPRDWCEPRAHGFSVGLALTLAGESAVVLLLAAAAFVASHISTWRGSAKRLQRFAASSLLVLPCLLVLWFSYPLFEATFPLEAVAGCQPWRSPT